MEEKQQKDITEELSYYRKLIDSTENQIKSLETLSAEVNTTISILSDPEIFKSYDQKMSIGSGIFIPVRIEEPERIIVPIGSDVFVEEDVEKARKHVEASLEQITSTIKNLYARRKELVNRYEALLMFLQRAATAEGKGKDA